MSPEEATDQFIDRLREVAACVTTRPVLGTGFRPSNTTYYAGIAPLDEPVNLQTARGNQRIAFHMRIEYLVVVSDASKADYAVHIASYAYRVADRADHEIIAWHLHTLDRSNVTHSHLHISSQIQPIALGRGLEPLPLADLHIPTGHVDLADIVRFLIAEVGIRPRKRDWEAILAPSA